MDQPTFFRNIFLFLGLFLGTFYDFLFFLDFADFPIFLDFLRDYNHCTGTTKAQA